jgi:hypothetical protein
MSSIKEALKQIADGFTALSEAVGDDWPPHVEVDVHVDQPEAEAAPKSKGLTRANLSKKSVAALRKIALQEGYEDEDVADASKEDLIDTLAEDDDVDSEEAEDEAEDDTEDDEEELTIDLGDDDDEEEAADEEDGDEYTRDDYEGMSLSELKAIAKEAGYTASDLRGQDADAIIDLLLGEEEDDEEEDDEGDEELTEDDLLAMSLAELKELAKEEGVRVKAGMKKADIVDAILEASE